MGLGKFVSDDLGIRVKVRVKVRLGGRVTDLEPTRAP